VVIVFAKAPRPGRVKTRLARALGALGAARLHQRMVEKALATAKAAGVGAVELHCASHPGHPFFRRMARRYAIRLRTQAQGDLGQRMHQALQQPAILIGSDCPELEPADLRAAARALAEGADAVFAPARDGGYALVGVRRADRRIFDSVDWGKPEVMAQTRERLRSLRWRWHELRTVRDIDRPADLRR
jgi:rSAM/selenodomain-associated transferase 1